MEALFIVGVVAFPWMVLFGWNAFVSGLEVGYPPGALIGAGTFVLGVGGFFGSLAGLLLW